MGLAASITRPASSTTKLASLPRSRLHHAQPGCFSDRLPATVNAEFLVDIGGVSLHGNGRNVQRVGDFLATTTSGPWVFLYIGFGTGQVLATGSLTVPISLTRRRRSWTSCGKYLAKIATFRNLSTASLFLRRGSGEGDPGLLAVLSQHADFLLKEVIGKDDFETQVRMQIVENLERRCCNAPTIAKAMHISVSTFKRRLLELNLGFRKLRDEIVLQIAEQALAETEAPVSEIAMRLGYSELSAFDRAFSRLAGITPLQYRQAKASRRKPGLRA